MNGLWAFPSTPKLCLIFQRELVGIYWGRSWILTTSLKHLICVWLNIHGLPNFPHLPLFLFFLLHPHLGHLCQCKGGGGTSLVIMGSFCMSKRRFRCWEGVLWWRGVKTFQSCSTFHVESSSSTLGSGDTSSFQPKVQIIVETWELWIGLIVTGNEVQEM
jgi:hypothetical protein